MQQFRIVLVLSAAIAAAPASADPAMAGGIDTAVPVLWESPACGHAKLGTVAVDIGSRVNESTQDARVPVVRAAPALTKLVHAAVAAGGNAVVLRSHQGVYFTHNGRRSSAPVYIKLRGAVVRLADGGVRCDLLVIRADELEQRLRDGKPAKVTAQQAYSGD